MNDWITAAVAEIRREARREALEEAADVCEAIASAWANEKLPHDDKCYAHGCHESADAIRALKDKLP